MKNKLMLLMLLSAQLGMQAADDQVISSNAHDDQQDTAQVSVEQREQDIVVRYMRDGQEFPPFDANLVYTYTMIKEYVDSCLEPMFKAYVEDMLQGLSFDAIKVLIQILSMSVEETKERLENLADDDVAALYEKAVIWKVENLATSCAQRLAEHVQDIEIVGDHNLSQEAERAIVGQVDFDELHRYIESRLLRIMDITYDIIRPLDSNRVLIYVDNKVMMHIIDTGKQENIFRATQGESVWDVCVVDSNNVLIRTNKRVIMHTIDIGKQEDICRTTIDGMCVIDSNRVLMCIDDKVMLHVIDTGKQENIVIAFEDESIQEMCVMDSNRVLIRISNRVIKHTIDTGKQEEICRAPINTCHLYVIDSNRVLISTGKQIILYTIDTGEQEEIYRIPVGKYGLEDVLEVHVIDNNRLLLQTSNRVIKHIIDRGEQEDIYRLPVGEYIRDVHVIDTHRVLIHAGKRIIVYTMDTSEQEEIHRNSIGEYNLEAYVIDSNRVFIKTSNMAVVLSIFDKNILKRLTIKQLQFLYKALDSWKEGRLYTLEERSDFGIYMWLPKELQNKSLFDASSFAGDEDLEFELLCEQACM